MDAVAAYLWELRAQQRISRGKLAAILDTSEQTIFRIEKDGQEPSGALLVGLIAGVNGSFEDVRRLALEPGMTAEDGRQLARERAALLKTAEDRVRLMVGEDPDSVLDAVRNLRAEVDRLEKRLAGTRPVNANG